jgi:hypothetical protein
MPQRRWKEMAKRFEQNNISHKLDALSETEFSSVLNYISSLEASRKELNTDDELISSLQNKRENRRARQVFEWETARRQTPSTNWLDAA